LKTLLFVSEIKRGGLGAKGCGTQRRWLFSNVSGVIESARR